MDVRRRTGTSIQVQTGSKRVCQERLSCEGATAEFECRECGTRQCGVCEEKLHSASAKLGSHSRTKIEPVSYADGVRLCGMWCYPYNSAEFSCIECKTLFCPECNRAFHRGKLSKHHRSRLPRPRPSETTQETLNVGLGKTPQESTGINGLPSILSESPDLDPFLDALPPPLTVLPPSHPSLDLICTEIKEKQNFEENEEDFLSLETHDCNQPTFLESGSVTQGITQKSELNQSQEEYLSLESNAKHSLEFLSGHFAGVESQPKTDIDCQLPDEIISFGDPKKGLELFNQENVLDKSLPNVEDPVMEFTMSRGMHASSDSDIGQLIIPEEYPHMDRGTGYAERIPAGVSPSTEESLLFLQNVSLNTTPPSSLESDPGRSRKKKEAVVRGMPRSPTSSMTDEVEALKAVTLQPLCKYKKGFLLVNENEELQVKSSEELVLKLGCPENSQVKVISIFGNTGDGKSFTLNHTFFGGQEVFSTSDAQQSCTIGVWAAYHKDTNVVAIDTEGLLGTSSNENKRMRLLLKILAISDVVIYRTRAERLGRDMFQFLGDASKAFVKHFSSELEMAMAKIGMKSGGLSSLGPAVVVFHETQHTKPLGKVPDGDKQPADTLLQKQFEDMGSSITAFRSLQYVGIQTVQPPTSFKKITSAILKHIQDTAVRSPRSPNVVYQALKVLNEKFSGNITADLPPTFPDEYFTCPERCLSCDARCIHTMNHTDKKHHRADTLCKYQHQFDNRVFLCMACSDKDGKKREVVPKTCSSNDSSWLGLMKYAWSGYVLECPKCGVIYRSRERWYGNEEPNVSAVRTEIRHIWTGDNIALQGTHNAARKLVDGISTVVDTISSVSAKPTKVMSQWMSDQIAPPYWRPNAEIVLCKLCRMNFAEHEEPIHHCRACGEGICDNCSQSKMPVPERGWGETPVRVCDQCYKKKHELKETTNGAVSPDEQPVTARMVGEVMQNTISTLGSAVSYPLGYMVDVARPAYWIPDHEITDCACCKDKFGPKLRIHHCRLCGKGICDDCSQKRRPVPSRGWDTPVRVCDTCDKKDDPL